MTRGVESRYYDGSYLIRNPDWDRADAPWKARKIAQILADNGLDPASICEVGCGSGDVLVHLGRSLPRATLTGFDISPQATKFWEEHEAAGERVDLRLGDFHQIDAAHYDVLLVVDVVEHLRDPFTFLEKSTKRADHFVFHIPLDLSANALVRGNPFTHIRQKVGHLHYYTKELALATLVDTGYDIVEWRYTGASLDSPNRSLRTRLAALPRRAAYAINKDFGVRLLGGETLLVLATSSS
jgi:hypothetical protein